MSDFTGDPGSIGTVRIGAVLQRIGLRTVHCPMAKALSSAAQVLLRQPGGARRRAIIVITDDKGTPVHAGIVRNAVRDLWLSDAVVLGVVVRSGAQDFWIGPPYRGAHYFAEQTGGDVLETGDPAGDLKDTLRRLRSRYSLYYALPPGKPGEVRKIRVQLTGDDAKRYPGATIRARTGYVLPGSSPR